MDEYAAVVRKFYEVYRPIGRRYNLRGGRSAESIS